MAQQNPELIKELKKRQEGQAGSQQPMRTLPPAPLQGQLPTRELSLSLPTQVQPSPTPKLPLPPQNTGRAFSVQKLTQTPQLVNSYDSLDLYEEFQTKFLRKDSVDHLMMAISRFIENPKEGQKLLATCLDTIRTEIDNDLKFSQIVLDHRNRTFLVAAILKKIVGQISDLKIQDIQYFNAWKLDLESVGRTLLSIIADSLLEQIRLRFPLSVEQQSAFNALKAIIQEQQNKGIQGLDCLHSQVKDFFENRLFLNRERTLKLIGDLEKAGISLPEYFLVGLPELQQAKVEPYNLSLHHTDKSEQFLAANLLYSVIGLDQGLGENKILPEMRLDAEGILHITIFSQSLKNRKQEASKAIREKRADNFGEIFGVPGKDFCFDFNGNIKFSFKSAHEANAFFERFGVRKKVNTEKIYRELCADNHFDLSEIGKKHELWEAFKAFKVTFKKDHVDPDLKQEFQATFFQVNDKLMKNLEHAITVFIQDFQSEPCQGAFVECLSTLCNKIYSDFQSSGQVLGMEEFTPIIDAIFDGMINNIKGLKVGHLQSVNLLMNSLAEKGASNPAAMVNILLNKMRLRFPLSKEHQKAYDELREKVEALQAAAVAKRKKAQAAIAGQEKSPTKAIPREDDVSKLTTLRWNVIDFFGNQLFLDPKKAQELIMQLDAVGISAPHCLRTALFTHVLTLPELENSSSESIVELKELGWFFLVFNSNGAKFKGDVNRLTVSGEKSGNTEKYALVHTQKSMYLCNNAITKNINRKAGDSDKLFCVIHKNDSTHVAINETSASQTTYNNVLCITNTFLLDAADAATNKLFSIPGHVQAVCEMTGKYELALIFFKDPIPSDETIRLNPSKFYLYLDNGSLFYAVNDDISDKVCRSCMEKDLSTENKQRIKKVLEDKSILGAGELSNVEDGKSFLAFLQIAEKAGYPILGLKLKEIKTSNTALRDLIFGITGLLGRVKEIDEEVFQELVDRAKREESRESLYEWYKEMAKYLLNNREGCFSKNYSSIFDCEKVLGEFRDEVYEFLVKEYKEDFQKRFQEIFQVVPKKSVETPMEKPAEKTIIQQAIARSLPPTPEDSKKEFKNQLSQVVGAQAVNIARALPGAGPLGSPPAKPNTGVVGVSSNTPPSKNNWINK